MQGKVGVVTGATSGIGQVAAEVLAAKGARIVLVARDRARGEAMLQRLRAVNATGHSVQYGDLSRLADMKRVAAEIAAAEPQIDVLVNNAGALFGTRTVTEDGLEATFALNHMSYFVVTNGLLGSLQAAARLGAGARIVSTASGAHMTARLDFDDLQSLRNYAAYSVYAKSKLCNVLHTRELARRLRGTGVTANCLHPGVVATRFGDNTTGFFAAGFKLFKRFARTPEQGAQTIIHLASAPEIAELSGGYFENCRPAAPSPRAMNDETARRLWVESERLAG